MGTLVAALGVSHTAQMVRDSQHDDEQIQRVGEAWTAARRYLEAARPDVLVVVSTEHLKSFSLSNLPTFCLGVGDTSEGWGDGGVPKHRVALQSEFARAFLSEAIEHEFDLAASHDMRLDHGFMTPLHFLTPRMDVPVVPLFQNCTTAPVPSVRRCYAVGQLLRRVVEQRPAGERVAVVGAGGLSHWLGVPGMGRINADFDRQWIALAAAGKVDALLAQSSAEICREAGNGGQELLNWLTMLGATNGATGDVIAYEPVERWITGIGLLAMRL